MSDSMVDIEAGPPPGRKEDEVSECTCMGYVVPGGRICGGCAADLRSEVARLTARVAEVEPVERAARSLMERQDFWRNAGTLPGEYDNLVDALAGLEIR